MLADSSPQQEIPSRFGIVLFIVVGTAILALAFLSRFHGFKIYDDAYMYVRYADHIVAGHGMVWNVGAEAVYGVPSLAYLLFAVIPFRQIFPDNPAAAIFSASFFVGLVFLGLIFRLALRVMKPSIGHKAYVMGFVMLALIATAVSLRGHFASGMETTLAMCYVTLMIGMVERMQQGKGNAWATGALMGIAWWIGPSMLSFSLGIPMMMVLLNWKAADRAKWLRILVLSLAGTGLCLLAAHAITGAWLPSGHIARSAALQGPDYGEQHRWTALAELARFMARSWPAGLAIGMGAFIKWRRLGQGYSALDKAMAVAMVVFVLLLCFLDLQVMGAGQRFYYPLLPFLIYLGIRELLHLQENLRLGPGFQFRRVPANLERIGIVALSAVLLYYGIDYGQSFKRSRPTDRLAVLDVGRSYEAEFPNYWPRLDRLDGLPEGLRIATTEAGIPAALYPQHTIDDLTGLNAPALVRDGLSAVTVLKHCPADLIYVPNTNYAQLSQDLLSSAEFKRHYSLIPAQDLKAAMGVAIRKDSPYATALLATFQK